MKLTYKQRKALPESAFALPEQDGYPIHDLPHARAALSRVSAFGSPEEKSKVRRKVMATWSSLRKKKGEE